MLLTFLALLTGIMDAQNVKGRKHLSCCHHSRIERYPYFQVCRDIYLMKSEALGRLGRDGEAHRKIFAIPLNAWQANPKLKQNDGYPPF
ncbi:MAG: hypothetical protein LIP06_12905 [Tannerellaceae bacterium]|nr:hypothetical protein [Tannerellaceae bacterium]